MYNLSETYMECYRNQICCRKQLEPVPIVTFLSAQGTNQNEIERINELINCLQQSVNNKPSIVMCMFVL